MDDWADEPPLDVFSVVFEDAELGLVFAFPHDCSPTVSGFTRSSSGEQREAEWRGSVPLGAALVSVGSVSDMHGLNAETLRALFQAQSRPVRVMFRLPLEAPKKDRYGFVRDAAYIDKELVYRTANSKAAEKANFQWLSFLKSLAGSDTPASPFARFLPHDHHTKTFIDPVTGIKGLRRDALGGFPHCAPGGAAAVGDAPGAACSTAAVSELMHLHKRNAVAPHRTSIASAPAALQSVCAAEAPVDTAVMHAPAVEVSVHASTGSADDAPPVPPELPSPHAHAPFAGAVSSAGALAAAHVVSRAEHVKSMTLPSVPTGAEYRGHKGLLLQLQTLVLAGIPPGFRAAIWYEMSGAAVKSQQFPPGFYSELVAHGTTSQVSSDIVKDLDRTFPGHSFFEHPSNITALQRLLTAFAARNPSIGYCQSMNFIAGMLLLQMPETDAFWVMDVLVNDMLPADYYTNSLLGLHADQRVLQYLIARHHPLLLKCLQELQIDLSLISLEWFMCQFVLTLPSHTALRVWDALFLFGSQALFRVALALFHINAPAILCAKDDFSAMFNVLQKQAGDVHDADLLMRRGMSLAPKLPWRKLNSAMIESMRERALLAVLADFEAVQLLREHTPREATTECTDSAADGTVAATGSGREDGTAEAAALPSEA